MSRAERWLVFVLIALVLCLELRNAQHKPVQGALVETQTQPEANRVTYHEFMQRKIADLDHEAEMNAIEQVRQEMDNAAQIHP